MSKRATRRRFADRVAVSLADTQPIPVWVPPADDPHDTLILPVIPAEPDTRLRDQIDRQLSIPAKPKPVLKQKKPNAKYATIAACWIVSIALAWLLYQLPFIHHM